MINKTIVLTGANGFLGSCLLTSLQKKYSTVIATSGHKNNNHTILEVNLLDFKKIKDAITHYKPDIVIHTGSLVDLSRDYTIGLNCIDNNIKGTLNLVEALRTNPSKKIIFTSTEEVYGSGTVPFVETQTPQPPSLYSVSKLAAEHITSLYASELNIALVILRIATFYGPCQPPRRFIPQMIERALTNKDVLLNSGLKKRDYIYIEDVINGILLACETNLDNKFEIINIGGGKSYTLEYLAQQIVHAAKSSSKIVKNAFPDRIGEAQEWILDISKAKKLLQWKPKISLQQGVIEEVAYFKKLWT